MFADKRGLLLEDPDHSLDERRYLLFGTSYRLRVLAVCYCYRGSSQVIRIISARKATRAERAQYEAG